MVPKTALLNLRHLRVFLEVAKSGGISAAARTVNLSQPAITQAIAKLEAVFQQKLFARGSTGMFLTEAGALLQARADRALAHIRNGCARALKSQMRDGNSKAGSFELLITSTQLRALLLVETSGSFSLAARNLGISQPSLHRAARDLEANSGMQLFNKTRQGIALTDAAKRLAQHTRLAIAEMRHAFEEIDATRGVDSARVVIGALPLARSHILPVAINKLTGKRPSVQVSIADGPYDDLLHGLRHGEIDLMIGALRDPLPVDDIEQHPLFSDRLGIYASPGHPLSCKTSVTLEDLRLFPWVVPRSGSPTRQHFDALFGVSDQFPAKGLVDTGSLVLTRGIVRGSNRLALISRHQMQEDLANERVSQIEFDLPGSERKIGMTTRKNWHPTQTLKEFLEILRGLAQKMV